MADPKNLAAVIAKQKAEAATMEAAENAAAASTPVETGKVKVRLTRPAYIEQKLLQPGIHLLDADAVPKSAKTIK